jgi:hypothetical protein
MFLEALGFGHMVEVINVLANMELGQLLWPNHGDLVHHNSLESKSNPFSDF